MTKVPCIRIEQMCRALSLRIEGAVPRHQHETRLFVARLTWLEIRLYG